MRKKQKLISLRLPQDLYDFYIKKSIENSRIKGKIITLSDTIRDVLIKSR